MKREKLVALDVLRIMGALFVFLFHMNIHFGADVPIPLLSEVIRAGAVFMVLFFMLSGFTLSYQYHSEPLLQGSSLRRFYLKRLFGVYPVYALSLIISALIRTDLPATPGQLLLLLPAQLLGIQSFFPNTLESFGNPNTWFISVILFLYLLFPFLNRLLQLLHRRRWAPGLLCAFLSIYVYWLAIRFGNGTEFHFYYNSPVFRVPEFFLGMFVAAWCREHASKLSPRRRYGALLALVSVAFLAGIYAIVRQSYTLATFNLCNIVAVPCFALAIALLATSRSSGLRRFAGLKTVQRCSQITFSFYMAQLFAILTVKFPLAAILSGASPWQKAAVCFIINISYALILHYAVEKPAKSWLAQRFLRAPNPDAVPG